VPDHVAASVVKGPDPEVVHSFLAIPWDNNLISHLVDIAMARDNV
jgi:hypothetical protein